MVEPGRLRGGTLFSGIGAPELAMGWVDWRWCAEIDPFACAVLAARFPGVPNLGDVTRIDADAVEPVDLVVGGPPCQGFSVAGNRGGLADPRGNLSLAYVRALDAIDPAWSLTENVPGWLSMGDNSFGHFLGRLVGADAPLVPARGQRWTDAGVVSGPRRTAAWIVKDAQFHGVPQRRRRVFVLAVRGSGNWSCAEALFPVEPGVRGDLAPRREAGESVAPSLTVGAHSSSGHQYRQKGNEDALIATALRARDGARGVDSDCTDTLIAFSAKDHGGDAGTIARPLRAGGHISSHANARVMSAIAFDPGQITNPMDWSNPQPGGPCHTLQAHTHVPAIAFDARQSDVCVYGDRAAPLDTDGFTQAVAYNNTGQGWWNDAETAASIRKGNDNGNGGARESTLIAHTLRADGFDASEDGTGRGTPLVVDMGGNKGMTAGGSPISKNITPPLVQTAPLGVRTACGNRAGIGVGAIAQTLRSNYRNNSDPATEAGMHVYEGMSVRRLTPVECARLQGFPDRWLDITYRGKPAADGNKYRSLGNSMAVPVIAWIGRRIQAVQAVLQRKERAA